MQIILKIIAILFLVNTLSFTKIFGVDNQTIILTGPQNTGSYIFARELSRIFKENDINKINIVNKIEPIQKNRLKHIVNNRTSLAIIDAKTGYEHLKYFPNLRVLSVLWSNWLYAIGNMQKPKLDFGDSKTFIIHENSLFFAKFWKNKFPKTKFEWFNRNNIPDFKTGISEKILILTAPNNIEEIFFWLEKFPGIQLLPLDNQIIKSFRKNYRWIIPKKLPANTYPFQTESIPGLAWHPILVSHFAFSEELVSTFIKRIFSQKEKINPHPLFKNLLIRDNSFFIKIFSYHTKSKRIFRFK